MRKALAGIVVAGLIAGCGGDDSGGKADASPKGGKTRAQFIAEADAVCKQSNASAQQLDTRLQRRLQNTPDTKVALKIAAPIIRRGNAAQAKYDRAMHELEPPRADRVVWHDIVAVTDQVAAMRKQLVRKARAGDTKQFLSIAQRIQVTQSNIQALAQQYGFRECGSAPSQAG